MTRGRASKAAMIWLETMERFARGHRLDTRAGREDFRWLVAREASELDEEALRRVVDVLGGDADGGAGKARLVRALADVYVEAHRSRRPLARAGGATRPRGRPARAARGERPVARAVGRAGGCRGAPRSAGPVAHVGPTPADQDAPKV